MRLNMESKTTSVLNRESRHGIMGEQVMVMVHDHHRHRHHPTSCRQVVCDEEVKSCYDDDSSPSSSSSSRTTSSSSSSSLQDMSSLLQQLPLKRGLSKHYNGKSQSFTSLSNVRSLEDLPKHDHIEINPHSKKLKTCKSYGAACTTSFPRNNTTCSGLVAAKNPPIKGSSFSSLVIGGSSNSTFLANNNNNNNNNNSNNNNRPPIPHPSHRSTNIISA